MTQNPKTSVNHRSRLGEKIGSMATILTLNVALFLLLGSYVVYKVVTEQPTDPFVFAKTKVIPPPPRPPARGGEAAKSLADPSVLVKPPVAAPPSVIVSSLPSSVSFSVDIPKSFMSLSSPDLTPSGAGMGSGTTGGGHAMPDPYGESPADGVPGLIGELYDLKQAADGTPTPIAIAPPEDVNSCYSKWESLPATQEGLRVLRSYVRGWDQNILDQYFKAPVLLEASQIFIPTRRSEEATKAFKVDGKVTARRWVVHYHGSILPPKSGRFRFLGFGDDFLVVRIGTQNVLDGSYPGEDLDRNANGHEDGKIPGPDGHNLEVGKWVDFESGISTSIDILIGEGPGGSSGFVLLIEEEGDTSAKGDYPVFQISSTPVPKLNNNSTVFTGKALVFPAQ